MQTRYECSQCDKISCNEQAARQHNRDKHGGLAHVFPMRSRAALLSDLTEARAEIERLTSLVSDSEAQRYANCSILLSRATKAEAERDSQEADFAKSIAKEVATRLKTEAERDETKALLQRAVDLIKGDLTGSEWKRACNAFVKDAQTALKGSAGMKFYRATVEILIRADGEGEALDGISGLLTETGMYDNNLIADWAYSHGPVEVNVPKNEQGREEYFADGNLNKGLPASTASSHDLEAYGREKMREGLQMAADIAMQRDEENGGTIFAEAHEFRDAILAEMETLK